MRIARRSFFRFSALLLGGVFVFTACALRKSAPRHGAVSSHVAAPLRVGTVALVNDEMHFVLVDVGSLYTPAAGTALKSRRAIQSDG